jgi:hypothetical protein
MIVPALIIILAGLGLIWLAVASWQERLPRNGLAGVRTPATMRSDQAFKVANKLAAPLTAAGGVVLALGGLLTALLPKHTAGPALLGGALVTAAICIAGALRGVLQPGRCSERLCACVCQAARPNGNRASRRRLRRG